MRWAVRMPRPAASGGAYAAPGPRRPGLREPIVRRLLRTPARREESGGGKAREAVRRTLMAMSIVATLAVLAIAVLHLYILVLEMFLWTTPRVRASFRTTEEFAASTKVLAANQGLYNGFLAAGLMWGAVAADPVGFQVKVFFLVCVAIAGAYGAATASGRILFVQTVPALVALALVVAAH